MCNTAHMCLIACEVTSLGMVLVLRNHWNLINFLTSRIDWKSRAYLAFHETAILVH